MKLQKQSLLLLCVVFFWFAQYIYIPFQTPYLAAVSVSADMIGIIVGAYGISQMLLRLPVGVMADSRNKHKIFIMIGGLASGSASLFRIILNNGTGFLIANLFSGLASALWISFMVMYTGYYSAEEQQKATSQIIFANNLGILIAFITGTIFYDIVGMRVICGLSVAGGLICAVLAAMLPKGSDKECSFTVPQLLSVCLKKELIFFALLALVQQGVQMSTTMSFTNQILRDMGASTQLIGLSSITYMISGVLWAKFASTDFCIKLRPKFWIPLVFCITAAYCILVPIMPSIWPIFLLQILPGMSTGILLSYLTGEAMQSVPSLKKSTALGFFQAVYALGMTVFPIIAGKITAASNMAMAYRFLAGTCLIAACCAVVYYKTQGTKKA